MLKYLLASGVDVEALIDEKKDNLIVEIPFDSKRKRQTTIVKCVDHTGTNVIRIYVKGATEAIVGLCQTVIGQDGDKVDLDDETKEIILGEGGVMKKFAAKCYRCLATSYKDYTTE